MGVLKFRFNPDDDPNALRRAYVTGQDRTPGRGSVDVRDGLLTITRPSPESGRLHVPWPVAGFGLPVVATATLSERSRPYDLGVELARGRLNDVRNQVADWQLGGLAVPDSVGSTLAEAQRHFAHAATSRDEPSDASTSASACIASAFEASEELIRSYTEQVLERRLEQMPKIPALLACGLDGDPRNAPWSAAMLESFNGARIRCPWASLAPDEGHHRWHEADAQLHWCRKHRIIPTAGPLLDLRPGALPDWLWLWDGDFDEIMAQAVDLVRQAVTRYRGKIAVWHLIQRAASGEVLGLSEEQQIRLTAKVVQAARQADQNAQMVVDFDRPWGEWMASSSFQLGPLHLADSLARADLGLAGVGLEAAVGYGPTGSQMRDLFEFSRMLDIYSLINLPIHVSLVVPSSSTPDPAAAESAQVDVSQWPLPPDETLQREWASRWVSLAMAKPFVRTVTWLQPTDASPHLYAHAGLFRADGSAKPAVEWFGSFRRRYLN